MPKDERVCANDDVLLKAGLGDLPEDAGEVLDRRWQDLQDRAMRLESMLHTLATCLGDPAQLGLCEVLLHHAERTAKELNNGLDVSRFFQPVAVS